MISELLIRTAPAATVLMILWICESFVERDLRFKLKHDFQNLLLAFINAVLLYFTVGFASIAVTQLSQQYEIGVLNWTGAPWPIALMFSFLALDLFGYLWHRANHRFAILWRLHRVHHSDANMNASTAARFHVGEIAIAGLVRLPLLIVIGVSTVELIVYEGVLVSVSLFHHSRLKLGAIDGVLRLFIVTPAMHTIHHSCVREEQQRNYASVLPIWDRLFHTYVGYTPIHPTGLEHENIRKESCTAYLLAMPFQSDHGQDVAKY